jgi:hypothetical protein
MAELLPVRILTARTAGTSMSLKRHRDNTGFAAYLPKWRGGLLKRWIET